MKKFIFCLLAIGMTVFASASNLKISPSRSILIKKGVTLQNKESVSAYTYCGVMTDGGWVGYNHSGTYRQCMSALILLLYCP